MHERVRPELLPRRAGDHRAVVVRDELDAGILVEHCRIREVTERFYAIVQKRRFPNPLLAEVLGSAKGPSVRR